MTEQQPPYPRPAYAWYCLGVICFAYLFGFMDRIIVGLLTPAIQADLGLSDSQMGIIQGLAFAVFYTLFGLPLGRLADLGNRKWLLTAGTALWSLMTAGAGLVRGFWGLFVMRAGVGVGEATLNPCATSLIGDYFHPKDRPKAFGIYTMSTALGTGVTYLGGGVIIAFIGGRTGGSTFDMPLLGEIPGWQAVFIIIGLAGLVPALLMALTVREPARRDLAKSAGAKASWAEIRAFLRQNRTTLLCHHFGVAFIVMAIYGWVNWLPTLFVRLHGWSVPQFSIWYGIFGGAAGIFSAIASGWFTNWLKAKGYADGTLRTVLIGGIGLTAGTSIAPLMPTPELVLAGYCITGVFTNFPTAQALSAVAEVTPNQLRGFVTSLYILVIGIAGAGLGPVIMGRVTDVVFADPMKIHYSMALVTFVMGTLGVALIAYGLKAFRDSLSRATWGQEASALPRRRQRRAGGSRPHRGAARAKCHRSMTLSPPGPSRPGQGVGLSVAPLPAGGAAVAPVPFKVRLGWGVGSLGVAILFNSYAALLLFYLTDIIGMRVEVAGLLLTIAKLYNVVVDVPIGLLSDHTRSPWGRRRPWMLGASFLCAASFVVMFNVPLPDAPGGSDSATWAYVLGALLFYATAYSAFNVPYMAMPGEMSGSYHERTAIMSFRVVFIQFGYLIGVGLAPRLAQALGGGAEGYGVVGWVLGIAAGIAMLASFFGTAGARTVERPAVRPPALEQLRSALTNRPFLLLSAFKLLTLFSGATVTATLLYFIKNILMLDQGIMLWYSVGHSLSALITVPLFWVKLSARIGKHRALMVATLGFMVVALSWLIAEPGESAWIFGLRAFLLGTFAAGKLLLGMTLLPDIMEYDSLRTGLRREGMFSGAYSLVEKSAFALSPFVLSLVLAAFGYQGSVDNAVMAQTEDALFGIYLNIAIVPAACNLLAALVLLRYDLTEERLREMRAAAAAR